VPADTPVPADTAVPTSTQPPSVQSTPTARPQPGKPWIWLEATSTWIAPGTEVTLELTLVNVGDAPLGPLEAHVQDVVWLTWDEGLGEAGTTIQEEQALVWELDSLAAHAEERWRIRGRVAREIAPGTTVPVAVTLEWSGGLLRSNEVLLSAPQALLPEAGG
jgi:hypothetical protein